ncbi:MAG TPA: DUF4178 domain-containing protein, partial [Kofleriaceae bacterium]|nr:DUF4178 domain-containing protein [Kofleriaceae bacterium]
KPGIALGAKGRFADGELTVIGYMQRSALVDGSWYSFDEYLLYAPAVGFRWLVCSDGHWSYVQPVAPGAVELMPVRYDGVPFELFLRAQLRVDQVLGEFYWLVQEGERVSAEDYIAPPGMLSCETSPTEQTWSLSTYLTAKQVREALQQPGMPLPPAQGVGANQPYPLHGIGLVAGLVYGALIVVGFAKCSSAKADLKHQASVPMPPGTFLPPPTPAGTPSDGAAAPDAPAEVPLNVSFTNKFQLEGGKNIEVSLSAPLANNWAYVAIDLVNDKTGGVVSFDQNLESYSGFTDGEAWSEGSNHDSQVLGPMEAGEYVMRVETLQGGPITIPLSITVRQDVFRVHYWLLAALFLSIPFGLIALHARGFKKKRWENSQLSSSSSYQASASDDDDGDSGWGGDDDDD